MGQVVEGKNTAIFGWWRKAREALFADKPRFDCLQVEVSSRCPGRCLYCPRALAGVGSGMDMSMAVFSRLAPVFRYAQRVHLQGWGEPFLNPSFFPMARIAREAGCRVSTTTCGLDMSESRAEAILDTGLDIVLFPGRYR
jgi:MoaA/NifB/PqqE/SkfB family radical SAM enzyme